ncbi:uncharacterized protein LOC141620004 [Silene latifolia]|uniref:uncharacterized protein LOC141620004 n=1 Tax=Silene latifolia TaxID=37657 RepID=UPI003D77CCF5
MYLSSKVDSNVFMYRLVLHFQALVLIHRFFALSLVVFFVLWHSSGASNLKNSVDAPSSSEHDQNPDENDTNLAQSGWDGHSWYYISVRIGLFLWSGSRLFGFIGAGATLGQLFGSLFATGMSWMGSYLLLVSALLMELDAQLSKGIKQDDIHLSEEDRTFKKFLACGKKTCGNEGSALVEKVE